MSYVGSLNNSMCSYRSSEQNARINAFKHHLRDNSGDRSFDRVDLAKKNKVEPTKKRTHSTAENVMLMRFPNLKKYDKDEQIVKEATDESNDDYRESIRLQKAEKWVSDEAIDEENGKDHAALSHSSEEEIKAKQKIRAYTSTKSKVDTERLIKPTYSSLKRSRWLPRDPVTKHTVSTLKETKVFSPANPRQAQKLLERNIYLNNLNDVNIDINKVEPSEHSGILGKSGLNKTANHKFVPNSKSPTHIKTGSGFINSTNGFETFLKKKDEIPRLSILENYKQISRIMRNSFLKAKDIEQRFKNNALSNEELKKKKEEEENTKKLTKILKQMNSPRNAFATS